LLGLLLRARQLRIDALVDFLDLGLQLGLAIACALACSIFNCSRSALAEAISRFR
jgi:hypothetical protein